MRKNEIQKYRNNLKPMIEQLKIKSFKDKDEMNHELRKFLQYAVPKKVQLALTVSHEGEVIEKMVTLMRDIALGKQHWIYSEFIEHDEKILPKWYVNATLQNNYIE